MQYYVKAIYALVIAVLGQLVVVLVGDTTFGDLSNGQWVTIALFGALAFGGILGWQQAPATLSTSVRE
jgi:hypothetical protein